MCVILHRLFRYTPILGRSRVNDTLHLGRVHGYRNVNANVNILSLLMGTMLIYVYICVCLCACVCRH